MKSTLLGLQGTRSYSSLCLTQISYTLVKN